jgi:hypothetical protein
MPEIIIEKINDKYRWEIKINGVKHSSGLEKNVVEAAKQADIQLEEIKNG